MATTARRGRPGSDRPPATPAKKTRTVAAAKAAPKKTAPHTAAKFAENEVTAYHKEFARWLLHGGVQLRGMNDADSRKLVLAAFLRGVSLATVARTTWMSSPEIEAWREREGIAKRGRKPGVKAAPKGRSTPVQVEDDEDDDFEDDEIDEDMEIVDEDDDDDDADEDDFVDEDDDDDDDDDEDEELGEDDEDEAEPAPAPKRRGRPAKAAPASQSTRRTPPSATRATKATPAKRAAPRKPKPASEDEFIF
jgi:hypothetical protein